MSFVVLAICSFNTLRRLLFVPTQFDLIVNLHLRRAVSMFLFIQRQEKQTKQINKNLHNYIETKTVNMLHVMKSNSFTNQLMSTLTCRKYVCHFNQFFCPSSLICNHIFISRLRGSGPNISGLLYFSFTSLF